MANKRTFLLMKIFLGIASLLQQSKDDEDFVKVVYGQCKGLCIQTRIVALDIAMQKVNGESLAMTRRIELFLTTTSITSRNKQEYIFNFVEGHGSIGGDARGMGAVCTTNMPKKYSGNHSGVPQAELVYSSVGEMQQNPL